MLDTTIQSDLHDDRVISHLSRQIDMFGGEIITQAPSDPHVYFNAPSIDLDYDVYIVCLSGGKDSFASLKVLLDAGVDRSKIQLWHHHVDGKEHQGTGLMDWAFIDDYVVKFAESVGIKLYSSWLKHGIEGEMLKNNSIPHNHIFETDDGFVELGRQRAKAGTRLKFPQQSASLATRWCSSEVKINIGKRALVNQEFFLEKRTLFITGERRAESSNRSNYNMLEPHTTDTMRSKRKTNVIRSPRHVDHWRPILNYSEQEVWEALEEWRLEPPVPYRIGWGRSSCQTCVFNSDSIWSTMLHYFPERLERIEAYEKQFDLAIARNGLTVRERAAKSRPFDIQDEQALMQAAQSEYTLPIFTPKESKWVLPMGAFSQESSGAA